MKNLFRLFFASVLVFSVSALLVQIAPAQDKQEKAAKQDRVEGNVTRSSKDSSTLTVRAVGSTVDKTVQYDSSTQFTSQEHGSKTVNKIDESQIKDGDRVIALGTLDHNGVLHATSISKRLSHSPH